MGAKNQFWILGPGVYNAKDATIINHVQNYL